MGGRGCAGWRRIKGRNKWENCNSIVNKIYLKINGKKIKMKKPYNSCVHPRYVFSFIYRDKFVAYMD